MTYQEFCTYIVENILKYMPEEYAKDSVKYSEIPQNNDTVKKGISITAPGRKVVPFLKLPSYYERYSEGMSAESVCMQIALEYEKALKEAATFAVPAQMGYEDIKFRITTEIVKASTNQKLLSDRPFTMLDDLAILYRLEFYKEDGIDGSAAITNAMFEKWNISVRELHDQAMKNMVLLQFPKLCTFGSVLFDRPENLLTNSSNLNWDVPWLILTKEEGEFGASVIANREILAKVAEVVDSSFYVIPSSIHEVLILPETKIKECGVDLGELGELIRETNEHIVETHEHLSDHVYRYDRDKRILKSVEESKTMEEESVEMKQQLYSVSPLQANEHLYVYKNNSQISMQTGLIGHLRGDFGSSGKEFHTTWFDYDESGKIQAFKEELDQVINSLRGQTGFLHDCRSMQMFSDKNTESAFDGSYCTEYGFRINTENYSYLFRLNPIRGDYNFYCYCYRKAGLDRHLERAEKGIRFIDSHYQDQFRIADGGKIRVTLSTGETQERICRFVDETHFEMGGNTYHICQFAELMEQNRSKVEPVDPILNPKQKEKIIVRF